MESEYDKIKLEKGYDINNVTDIEIKNQLLEIKQLREELKVIKEFFIDQVKDLKNSFLIMPDGRLIPYRENLI